MKGKLADMKASMTPTEKVAGSLFFASLLIGCIGALGYETYAIASNKTPTISKIAAGEIAIHPNRSIVVSFVAGGAVAGLVAHFADTVRWWQP